jgi:hypothetical protein
MHTEREQQRLQKTFTAEVAENNRRVAEKIDIVILSARKIRFFAALEMTKIPGTS